MSVHWQHAEVILNDQQIFGDKKLYSSPAEAHRSIRRSLRMRLQHSSIKPDDVIEVTVWDASGYFKSCPEIFPGYYHKKLTVAEYVK